MEPSSYVATNTAGNCPDISSKMSSFVFQSVAVKCLLKSIQCFHAYKCRNTRFAAASPEFDAVTIPSTYWQESWSILWKWTLVLLNVDISFAFLPLKTCVQLLFFIHTNAYIFIHLFFFSFFFLSSTGASLNDFWQTYPVVQRHLKINCPFPSISSWLLLNSNHISPPLSWAPLPKVEPVTHHKRKERVR